jgi:hypothetical protein
MRTETKMRLAENVEHLLCLTDVYLVFIFVYERQRGRVTLRKTEIRLVHVSKYLTV